MARIFIAQFSGGYCPECLDIIQAGDEVSYAVDRLVHAECNDPSLAAWDDEYWEEEYEG